jgi:phosphopantothenoylcysteine decarboxylase/phosphopantothenate--cysteine ligase
MNDIAHKRLIVGVTGGIAAYKAAELVRLFVKAGIAVQVVMTEAARGFVAPATFQALSGRPVFSDMWDARIDDNMAHIELSRGAAGIVVAPATADFIARLVHGLADDLLSTLCLARECPLLLAPAMNRQMWENAATQRNVAQLARDGVLLAGPAAGDQACGETGLGRMIEPQQIFDAAQSFFQPPLLAGRKVLITAGPTFEAIDTVRAITNRSSGKMGYAVAQAALEAGAAVTLVSGPTALTPPAGAGVIPVESAQQMFDTVKRHINGHDIFIGVAAVADYRVETPSAHKIKKEKTGNFELQLVPNPDILEYVANLPRPPFCVGFAAESEKLAAHAQAKRRRKKLPLIAANLAQDAIGADDNELTLFDDAGAHRLPRAPKIELARRLVAHIARLQAAHLHPQPVSRRGKEARGTTARASRKKK